MGANAEGAFFLEPLVMPGDRVLWDNEYWTVRRVNIDKDENVYSMNLDRPGVTTCVSPRDVVFA